MITIIDLGIGNTGAVKNMLKKVGHQCVITSDHQAISDASKLILPGVGTFDVGMSRLEQLDLIELLTRKVIEEKIPVLGICLGMQLLSRSSEEGTKPGLSWIEADVIRFNWDNTDIKLKIPHMGWTELQLKKESKLFETTDVLQRFYFVHSYHVKCDRLEDVLGESVYGIPFTAAIEKENIFGVQFHPEKSHKYGMSLLRRFAEEC